MKLKQFAALLTALTFGGNAMAATIDFSDNSTGANLDGQTSGTYTVNELPGLSITIESVTPGTGVFNATGSQAGINSDVAGDGSDEFDVGETFSFSFSDPVSITEFDFAGITSAGSDSFTLSAGVFSVTLNSGNTSGSVYTPASAIELTAGDVITFDNISGNGFGLDAITLTVIPEPASMALLAAGGLLIAGRQRRRA